MTDNQIMGILSGWDKIESEIRVGLHEDYGKSKDIQDILDLIHELQITANTVSPLRKLFQDHVTNYNNPHQVTISIADLDLLAVLYDLYTTRFGVDMTISEFGYALINIKRFATRTDVDNGTNPDSIINIDTLGYMIYKHDISPVAHSELFRYKLPGIPLASPPAEVFEPNIIMNNIFVTERFCTMNYHDINGRVKTIGPDMLAIDYSYGKPAAPIFGPHRNIMLNSRLLTDVVLHGGDRSLPNSDLFIITPKDDTDFLLFQENATNDAHGFRDDIPEEITGVNTYCIYVYPLDRNCFVIAAKSGAEVIGSAAFDCDSVTSRTDGHLTKLRSSIEDLPNGWYRCSITFDATGHNLDAFDIQLLETLNIENVWNIYYQGVTCYAMGFWQHQLTKTALPAPPVFTVNSPITVLGTKIRRDFTQIFNPIKGTFVARFLSPMPERYGIPNTILRIGSNGAEPKTVVTVGSNLINLKRNRITTYNVNNEILELIDSDPYDPENPVFMKRVAFTYGLGYHGYGFTDSPPKLYATSVDSVLAQVDTFFETVYDGNIGPVGVRILQMPQDIIEPTDNEDDLVVGTLANTSQYRLNNLSEVLELGYDSVTDTYLEGYLLNFRYYSVLASEMNLEFLMDQYIPRT